MEQKNPLQNKFLKAFIEQLIIASGEPGMTITIPQPRTMSEIQFPKTQTTPVTSEIKIKPREKIISPIQNLQKRQKQFPIARPQEGYMDLGKLNILIGDRWIKTIECQGPGKKILVTKGSKVFQTKISLSEEEIRIFIDQMSRATKIPLAEGLFSAQHKDLMITAIASDIGGSRFVIQRIPSNQ